MNQIEFKRLPCTVTLYLYGNTTENAYKSKNSSVNLSSTIIIFHKYDDWNCALHQNTETLIDISKSKYKYIHTYR